MSANIEKRILARKIKNMPDNKVYDYINEMCQSCVDDVVEAAVEVLRNEFKFGHDRQQKFVDELHNSLNGNQD